MRRRTVGIIGNAMGEGPGSPSQRAGERYIRAVAEISGAVPLIIPGLPETQDTGHLVEILDGILLTGGRPNVHPSLYGAEPGPAYEPYDPGRDAVALPLVLAAVEAGRALFGVCRGFQEINVAFGGTLHPEIRDLPGRMNHRMPPGETDPEVIFRLRHKVSLAPGGRFAGLLGAEEVMVNSLHGQGLLEAAPRVVVEGWAEDGTPEALHVEGALGFAVGVQWHAEYGAGTDPVNRRLFEAFGAAMG
ncbi:MAG TPA: gamma-glutamyl-gamma-aminobutyrate hydrolase family protein [Thermohalobaculum sp.]|nr:gamma-glutamyl-gamma-aminobutyrate hydrolase family protein [Thermohalobaculum sp.]